MCASANCSIRRSRDPEALDDDDRYRMQDPKGRQESGDHRYLQEKNLEVPAFGSAGVFYMARRARLRLENARRSYRASLASLLFKSVMPSGAAVSAK